MVKKLKMNTPEGYPEDEKFVSSVFEEVVNEYFRRAEVDKLTEGFSCGGPYRTDGKRDKVYELNGVRTGMRVLSLAFTDDSAEGNPNHAVIGVGKTVGAPILD